MHLGKEFTCAKTITKNGKGQPKKSEAMKGLAGPRNVMQRIQHFKIRTYLLAVQAKKQIIESK